MMQPKLNCSFLAINTKKKKKKELNWKQVSKEITIFFQDRWTQN